MPHLDFVTVHSYSDSNGIVTCPVRLRSGTGSVRIFPTIDTGASDCLFERKWGDWLGLDIEAGEDRIFHTATGPLHTFGHIVQIVAFDIAIESMVYFFADPAINKNLLGRNGFLDRLRLGLVHYDRELYLAPYDR